MKKEQTKDYKIFNWARIFITFLVFIALCAVSIWLKNTIDLSKIPWLQYEFDIDNMTTVMSGVCQVQAAIVGIVLTVLSVSIAVNKNEIYDLKIKEYVAMKTSKTNYSLLEMIFIQVVLIAFSIFMLTISSFALLLTSFVYSCFLVFWICATNLPIALNPEKQAIAIISNQLEMIDLNEEINLEEFTDQEIKIFTTTKNIILDKGLSEGYLLLKNETDEKRLFDKILISLLIFDRRISPKTSIKQLVSFYDEIEKIFDYENNERFVFDITTTFSDTLFIHAVYECILHSSKYLNDNFFVSRWIFRIIEHIFEYCTYGSKIRSDEVTDDEYDRILKICRKILANIIDEEIDEAELFHVTKIVRDILGRWPKTVEVNGKESLWAIDEEVEYVLSITINLLRRYYSERNGTFRNYSNRAKENIKKFTQEVSDIGCYSWNKLLKLAVTDRSISYEKILNNEINRMHYTVKSKDLLDWWLKFWIISKKNDKSPQLNLKREKIDEEILLSILIEHCESDTRIFNIDEFLEDIYEFFDVEKVTSEILETYLYELHKKISYK